MNDAIVDVRPRFIVLFGRGRTGKTTFARLLVDRAHEDGRMEFAIADADRSNPTMGAFYQNVLASTSIEDQATLDFLDDLVNAQVEDRVTILLDTGGADPLFPSFARSLDLLPLLAENGIVPVAVHMIGPDPDDLAVLRDLEAADSPFKPDQTILVLNASNKGTSFARVEKDPSYKAAIKRGAKEVRIPHLMCMQHLIDNRWTLAQAAEKLKVTDRHRLFMWRKAVEEALAPVREFLP